MAVGISTADPERFFKEMKEAIFDVPLTNPSWNVAFGCVVGYDFVCVDKDDVGWMQQHFPGVELNIMYKSPSVGKDIFYKNTMCHYIQ